MSVREVIESPLEQGVDEEIYYQVTTTPWGSSPTSVSTVAKDLTTGQPVTDTVLSGFEVVSSDVITLPKLSALTADHVYRIEVKFTVGGNVQELYFIVNAKQ